MRPVESSDTRVGSKKRPNGDASGNEKGDGSGYKTVGLGTSDRISLYMESKCTAAAGVGTGDPGGVSAIPTICKVSHQTTNTPLQKKRRRI